MGGGSGEAGLNVKRDTDGVTQRHVVHTGCLFLGHMKRQCPRSVSRDILSAIKRASEGGEIGS